MMFERLGLTAVRALASAVPCVRASTSVSLTSGARSMPATTTLAGAFARASTSPFAALGAKAPNAPREITVMVERGEADRAYKRLRRIMVSEGIYKDLRKTTEGHRKPSELRVIARKEREQRTYRKKVNSKLGWIMRRKERGF